MVKRNSIFMKLLAGNLLLMMAIIVLGGLFSYRLLDEHLRHDEELTQEHLAGIVQRCVEQAYAADANTIDALCKTIARQDLAGSQIRITVLAYDGQVLGDSVSNARTMENHKTASRPEVLAALNGQTSRDVRYSDTLKTDLTYLAKPLTHNGRIVGAVRLAIPVKVAMQGEQFLRKALAYSALAGLGVAIVLGLLVSWIWYAPLKRISITARQLTQGDLTAHAVPEGPGELADLARAFNEMRSSLSSQIRAVAAERENLQTVLVTLGEGVVALNAAGKIVLLNQPASRLLNILPADAVGKDLPMVLRIPEVTSIHTQCVSTGLPVGRQIEIHRDGHRRIVDVQAAMVPSGQSQEISSLLVFRDVTVLARTSAVKAEFVANASHELRTPLATIRAAVDSLASAIADDPDSVNKLLGMLDRHVQRLENMTKDLLDLHLVESGKIRLTLETIPLKSLAQWCASQFGPRAEELKISLDVSASPEDAALCSDRKLLELILRNLIDNALKFTPTGGSVQCAMTMQGDRAVFRVSDTGCGIRPEDQPRVFERFFQADASRTGDTRVRGTGLGLAIVRHSAERLGAEISLQSDVGKGATFTVSVPGGNS